jgi:hypothetical protein
VPSGSVALLGKRSDEDIKNGMSRFRCGICGKDNYKQTWEGGKGSVSRPHFCDDCEPLAALALKREHYGGRSEERAAIYTKIKSIVEALRRPNSNVTAGPEMPFCLLSEEFKGRYRRIYKSSSLRVDNPHFKSTIIFFADMPIGRIGDEEVLEFHKSLLSGSGRCAPLSKATAVKTVETFKRILFFAVGEGWLERLPDALGPISRNQRVSGHILSTNQNGNGQKNGGLGKRAQGRPPKPDDHKKAEVADTLRRIQTTVLALKAGGKERADVKANLVASELGIGGVTGGDTMMRQVNKCGNKITWPRLRDAIWDDSKIIP